MENKAIVGIITNETVTFNGRHFSYSTGKRYVNSVIEFSNVLPILIPNCITQNELEELLNIIDGVVLTGGRANVEPHHYDGISFPQDEIIDPERDKIVFSMIPQCIKRKMPIFGICRGIQEINVAFGGTLFYRVHKEKDKTDHRMPKNETASVEEIFKPRHKIGFPKNGLLKNLIGRNDFIVNSLHGQGIDRLGTGLTVEAYSEDGLIEAISITDYKAFGVGIQWHAEFHPEREENRLNKKLYEQFGDSCRAFRSTKQ